MRVLKIALAALCAVFLSLSAALAFDPAALSENDQALNKFRTSLDGITEKLRNPTLSEEELLGHRLTIEDLRTGAVTRSASIAGWIAEVNQQIKSLGEPPAPGASEDAGIAKTRADLIAMRDRLQSLKSQFDVIAVEAGQSAGRVSTLQRDQFLERIFDGNRSILNPSLWYDMAAGLGVLLKSIGLQIEAGWAEVGPRGNPLGLLIIPVCFLIFAAGYQLLQVLAKRWVSRFSSRGRAIDDMTRLWRIARALITVSVVPCCCWFPWPSRLKQAAMTRPSSTACGERWKP